MIASNELLEARTLNSILRTKAEGLLSMLNASGDLSGEDKDIVACLQKSIALHEYCEGQLKKIENENK